jgi:phytoene synthase
MLMSDYRYASPADQAACRALIKTGSKSFYAASLLLPQSMRMPSYSVYAFCRLADDEVDLETNPARGLQRLHHRLEAVYAGYPEDIAADRALADTVRDYGIPKDLFDALLDGFQWDVDGRRYETLDALYGYGARVAGAVGAIMTLLMGNRDADTLARACDLGVAMQLTNIARDVGEDAREGRLYLPQSWLREVGIDPDAFLEDPQHSPELGAVIQRLLAAAEVLYQRSETGVAQLPLTCRPAINAARWLYAAIGRVVAQRDHDSVSNRAVVSTHRKLGLVLGATIEAPLLTSRHDNPALEQTEFLVRAATTASAGRLPLRRPHRIADVLDAPAGHILQLFIELEQRDRQARAMNNPAQSVQPSGMMDASKTG